MKGYHEERDLRAGVYIIVPSDGDKRFKLGKNGKKNMCKPCFEKKINYLKHQNIEFHLCISIACVAEHRCIDISLKTAGIGSDSRN